MTGKKRLRNFVDGNASKNKKAKSEDSVMKTVKCTWSIVVLVYGEISPMTHFINTQATT